MPIPACEMASSEVLFVFVFVFMFVGVYGANGDTIGLCISARCAGRGLIGLAMCASEIVFSLCSCICGDERKPCEEAGVDAERAVKPEICSDEF